MTVKLTTCPSRDTPQLAVVVEAFADHLFALLPERLGALRIEGVTPHATADARLGNHLGDVAVFAITTANRLSLGDTGGPHRSCRTFQNAFIPKGRGALRLTGIDFRNQFLDRLGRQVPTELG